MCFIDISTFCLKSFCNEIKAQKLKTNNTTWLGDNCIKIFYLGRYIIEYKVRNLVLRLREGEGVKRDFRPYIRRYTSPNKYLNTVIPILIC